MAEIGEFLPRLLEGAWLTVQITLLSAALALVLAFVAGLSGLSRSRLLRGVTRVYVEFFRGTSVMVQLFWLFFALPLLGWELEPMFAGILALGLNLGAYGSEVVRGAVQAIPKEQYEATTALNMTGLQRMRLVILPQAVVGMLPPFGNLIIELMKATALVSLITLGDLTFNAQVLRASTGETTLIFTMVLLIYFALAQLLTVGMRWLERRAKASIGQPVATPKIRWFPQTSPLRRVR
jgi:polar amino acid transport system permease protein